MTRRTFATTLAGTAGALALKPDSAQAALTTKFNVYFGTYTDVENDSKGIYVAEFDAESGVLNPPRLAAKMYNPSFLELHPDGKHVYAVGELSAAATAFKIGPDGSLEKINEVSTEGDWPCHVAIDRTGRMAVAVNYGSGSVISYRIEKDGSLSKPVSVDQHTGHGVNPDRQEGPHAHSANFSPDNRFVLVCDLGLDKIFSYEADPATGSLKLASVVDALPGSGPRHLAFHPNGKILFANNEMLLTLTAYAYDAPTGKLTRLETVSALPKHMAFDSEYSTAETRVHPNGRSVYVSVRKLDSIAHFHFDEAGGKLTHVSNIPSGGSIPRNFNIDPTGRWLLAAHQDSGNVVVFAIDRQSGALTHTGLQQYVDGSVCVRFHPLT